MKKITKKQKEAKIKEAIEALNSIAKIQLAPSPIHGVGVFAMRNLKKDEKLDADGLPAMFDVPYTKFNKLKPEIREMILGAFPLIVENSHFLYPYALMSAYLNHSDDPNYDAKNNVCLRDIKKGEEITENYRLIPSYTQVFPWLK